TAPAATASQSDDRPAWQRYARPFDDAERRPRLAVVITGLGLSSAATEAAIRRLPPEISLSFSPYARGLNEWLTLARANGHEVLIDLPMEPANFPADDPGPQALLTSLDESQNLERLAWVLQRGSGYVGVVSTMGARFTLSPEHLRPVLEQVKKEGLMLLDSRTTDGSLAGPIAAEIGLPVTVSDRALDVQQASSVAIDANLIYVERQALAEGAALAIGQPYPVTIERLVEWSGELDGHGIALVPVTAIVGKQHIRPLVSTSKTGAASSTPQPTEPTQ
ncbi:MAG: divergent polysaccharide deacetylase family protein, partial [Kiloniellales bacterium]